MNVTGVGRAGSPDGGFIASRLICNEIYIDFPAGGWVNMSARGDAGWPNGIDSKSIVAAMPPRGSNPCLSATHQAQPID